MRRAGLVIATFRAKSWIRSALRRDMTYEIVPGRRITLPPDHMLPLYQAVHPLYDRYFLEFFRALGRSDPGFTFIDIGANVGDTAMAVSSVAPGCSIVCVEGSEYFLRYLRRNVASLPGLQVIEAFVSGIEQPLEYSRAHGTGHLQAVVSTSGPSSGMAFVTPAGVMACAPERGLVIWKSDTDGHDVAILLAGFDEIVRRSEIILFELKLLEPESPEPADLLALVARLSSLDRDILLVDNFGRLMHHVAAADAPPVILDLERWLRLQRASGTVSIDYFDVWVLPADRAEAFIASLPA